MPDEEKQSNITENPSGQEKTPGEGGLGFEETVEQLDQRVNNETDGLRREGEGSSDPEFQAMVEAADNVKFWWGGVKKRVREVIEVIRGKETKKLETEKQETEKLETRDEELTNTSEVVVAEAEAIGQPAPATEAELEKAGTAETQEPSAGPEAEPALPFEKGDKIKYRNEEYIVDRIYQEDGRVMLRREEERKIDGEDRVRVRVSRKDVKIKKLLKDLKKQKADEETKKLEPEKQETEKLETKKQDESVAEPQVVKKGLRERAKEGAYKVKEKAEKTKETAAEIWKNKEARKQIALAGVDTIGSVLGYKFFMDLWRYASQSKAVKTEREETEQVMAEVLRSINEYKQMASSDSHSLDDRKNQAEAADRAYVQLADKLKQFSKAGKTELASRLTDIVEGYQGNVEAEKNKAMEQVDQVLRLYIRTKITKTQLAKQGLNTALVASGAFALRGVVFAGGSAIEWCQKVHGERKKQKFEGKGEEEMTTWKKALIDETRATCRSLAGKGRSEGEEKWQKAVDMARAYGKIAQAAGIVGLAFEQDAANQSIDKLLDAMSGRLDLGTMRGNFVGNAEARLDLIFHPEKVVERQVGATAGVVKKIFGEGEAPISTGGGVGPLSSLGRPSGWEEIKANSELGRLVPPELEFNIAQPNDEQGPTNISEIAGTAGGQAETSGIIDTDLIDNKNLAEGVHDSIWRSTREMFLKPGNPEKLGYDEKLGSVNKWAEGQTAKVIARLSSDNNGDLKDLVHPGDKVILKQDSGGLKIEVEPKEGGPEPGYLRDIIRHKESTPAVAEKSLVAKKILSSAEGTSDAAESADAIKVLEDSLAGQQKIEDVFEKLPTDVSADGEVKDINEIAAERFAQLKLNDFRYSSTFPEASSALIDEEGLKAAKAGIESLIAQEKSAGTDITGKTVRELLDSGLRRTVSETAQKLSNGGLKTKEEAGLFTQWLAKDSRLSPGDVGQTKFFRGQIEEFLKIANDQEILPQSQAWEPRYFEENGGKVLHNIRLRENNWEIDSNGDGKADMTIAKDEAGQNEISRLLGMQEAGAAKTNEPPAESEKVAEATSVAKETTTGAAEGLIEIKSRTDLEAIIAESPNDGGRLDIVYDAIRKEHGNEPDYLNKLDSALKRFEDLRKGGDNWEVREVAEVLNNTYKTNLDGKDFGVINFETDNTSGIELPDDMAFTDAVKLAEALREANVEANYDQFRVETGRISNEYTFDTNNDGKPDGVFKLKEDGQIEWQLSPEVGSAKVFIDKNEVELPGGLLVDQSKIPEADKDFMAKLLGGVGELAKDKNNQKPVEEILGYINDKYNGLINVPGGVEKVDPSQADAFFTALNELEGKNKSQEEFNNFLERIIKSQKELSRVK